MGSKADQPIAQAIQAQLAQPCINLTGKTHLSEAIDALAMSALVVSNDSGLMHIAAALRRPLIAIYGSSSHRYTPPLSPQAQALSLDLACSPCFKRDCPLGHTRCLNDLTGQYVLEYIDKQFRNLSKIA